MLLHQIKDQHCWLSTNRCIFWEEEKTLILADLHFGKTGHFRKSGIAVPVSVYKEDLQRLVQEMQYFQPKQLIIVGDMFHSHANKEIELFKKWRHDFEGIEMHLVKGNHDILNKNLYTELALTVHKGTFHHKVFSFCHDCEEIIEQNDQYTFTGHLHPGIRLSGKARQALQFPCYYFTPEYCVLPAFSKFTGYALVKPRKNDRVFAIAGDKVLEIK